MTRVVFNRERLVRLARDIRARFDDEDGFDLSEMPTSLHTRQYDARERKWAAGKLLQPLEAEEFTDHEQLEICRQAWEYAIHDIRAASESRSDRIQRIARQFYQTSTFVQSCWNLRCETEPEESYHTIDAIYDHASDCETEDDLSVPFSFSDIPEDNNPADIPQ